MPLSPVTRYYLRSLFKKNLHRLKFIVVPNAALEAHPLADLDAVISSLYLDPESILEMTNKLEDLVKFHRTLEEQGPLYRQHQTPLEEEIFWILGFKLLDRQQTT